MSLSSRFMRPLSPAALLLLGLLALLLWGQCAALLNAGGSTEPLAANFYASVKVDSLSKAAAGGSMKVYLKVQFDNYQPRVCRLDTVWGNVSFAGQQWAFKASSQAKGLTFERKQHQEVPVVLLITGANSMKELRRTFYEGSTGGNSLRLDLNFTYFPGPDFSLRIKEIGASYLPGVTPRL